MMSWLWKMPVAVSGRSASEQERYVGLCRSTRMTKDRRKYIS